MSQEYPNKGALFKTKEKKFTWSPDYNGSIDIDRDYLIGLLKESKGLVKVKIDATNKTSSNGLPYMSLKVNTWKPENQQAPAKDPWDE
jgi:hypothetical protein